MKIPEIPNTALSKARVLAVCVCSSLASLSTVCAQSSLDESIQVDGRYRPEVIRMERIARYPSALTFATPTETLDYDLRPRAADFGPCFLPLPPYPRANRTGYRGYVQAEAGSWLCTALKAGIWVTPEDASWQVGLALAHKSTSLWKGPDLGGGTHMRLAYDEAAGITVSHHLADRSLLEGALSWKMAYFNYYTAPGAPSQTVNDAALDISLTSPYDARLQYKGSFSASYFSYRAMPWAAGAEDCTRPAGAWPSREATLHAGMQLSKNLDYPSSPHADEEETRMTLDCSVDGVFPGHGREYGLFSFTPGYEFRIEPLQIRIGARIDLSAGASTRPDSYSTVHVAPDCRVVMAGRHFTGFITVWGGATPATLANLSKLTLFQLPHQMSTSPLYSPFDLELGFNGGPSEGMVRGIDGELAVCYKSMLHIPLLGDYPSMLLADCTRASEMLGATLPSMRLSGFGIRGRLGWHPESRFGLDLNLAYAPQNSRHGMFNGLDRPVWTGSVSVGVHPLPRLSIGGDLNWRGDRKVYGRIPASGVIEGRRLPDYLSLQLKADWACTDRLTAGVSADNVTCRRNWILPDLPTQRLTLLATATWLIK